MKKILVNAPKGGVGKTTLATNIALYLAERGFRVWAMDLAQGEQMTIALENRELFGENQNENKIQTNELESIPRRFPGQRAYDYLVVDTDDYYEIIKDLADGRVSRNWYVIVPIMDEYNGLQRITKEIRAVMVTYMLTGNVNFNLKLVPNKISDQTSLRNIYNELSENGLGRYMSDGFINNCISSPPYFIDDTEFHHDVEQVLNEIGVI